MNDSHTEPVVAEVVPSKNPFKALSIVLSILVILLVGALSYLLLNNMSILPKVETKTSTAKSYTVDLGVDALIGPTQQTDTPVLTINDLSDSFTDKYLVIDEWGLKIKTKYADLLEYEFLPLDKNAEEGSTPYSECNGDYLHCDSVLAIRLKEQYVDTVKEQEKQVAAYGEDAGDYKDRPEQREIAYIYQDNRNLSRGGTETARYWKHDSFKTDFGTTGTLLFDHRVPSGVDDNGFVNCGVELTIKFDSATPCEDIFLSLYRFDVAAVR